MKTYETIGLDKTEITNFYIQHIDDILLFKNHKNVKRITYSDDAPFGLSYLKIADNYLFGDFIISIKENRKIGHDMFTSISINVSNIRKNNLHNITFEELIEHLKSIENYLAIEYGIICNLLSESTCFRMMEINCNLSLSLPFASYTRVLQLAMFNLPSRLHPVISEYKSIDKANSKLNTETFIRANNSMKVEIYDKGKQLKDTKKLEQNFSKDNILRIEIKLLTAQKIKESLGTNLLSRLNTSMIQKFYKIQFEKLFVKPYISWKLANKIYITNLITEHQKNYPKTWRKHLLKYLLNKELESQIPQLLDTDEFMEIMISNEKYHKKRLMQTTEKQLKDFSIFQENDAKKMEEIINSFNKIASSI